MILHVDNPPILQVRNSLGELLGMLKGPFPEAHLRRGWLDFAYCENPEVLVQYRPYEDAHYVKVSLKVGQYYYIRDNDTYEVWWVILSENVPELYRLKQFRWSTRYGNSRESTWLGKTPPVL